MSYLKCANSLKAITTNVRRILFVSNKSLCSKKVKDFNVTIKIGDDKVEKKKSQSIFFDEDDETGTVVVTEREKEASVKSRLSKECNKIYGKHSSGQKVQAIKIQNLFDTNVDAVASRKALDEAVLRIAKDPPDSTPCKTKSKSKPKTKLAEKSTADPKSKPFAEPKCKLGTEQTSQPTVDKSLDKTITLLKDSSDAVRQHPGDRRPPPPPPRKGTIVRQEAGEVIYAFIPREWFTAFIPKTGVTGFGTFLFTTGTYLISKEYYVLEHNYYGGLSIAIMMAAAIRYVGPRLAAYLDKEIEEYENQWNQAKKESVIELENLVVDEIRIQYEADGALMLVAAKRENVHLQLENEFRSRQMTVYEQVTHILNYHVAVADIRRKIQQRNLVDYVTNQVLSSFTPEMQQELVNVSIDNLIKELSKHKEEEDRGTEQQCKKE